MSANSSTRSNQSVVIAAGELERIIHRTQMKCESSVQIAYRVVRIVALEEALAMKAWTTELNYETENCQEIEELEDDAVRWDGRSYECDCHQHNVIATIARETKKETAAIGMEKITNSVGDTVVEVINTGYTSAKEGIKAPIFPFDGGSPYPCCPTESFGHTFGT